MDKENHTKEIDFGLAKILVLCNILNRKTELCCFVNDVAHCRYIEVRVYKDVKSFNGTPIEFEVHYENRDSEYLLKEINRCVEYLEKLLKKREIDLSVLTPIKEYVITSYEI